MTGFGQTALDGAATAAFAMLAAAMVLAFVRLVRGPSLADRVVALDLITTLAIAFIAVGAVALDEPAYLGVALVLALVAFLGTVAFAFYLKRRGRP